MVKELRLGLLMAIFKHFMMVSGSLIKEMDMVFKCGLVASNLKDNGKMI